MIDEKIFGDGASVFRFFNEISKIPRGSGNTAPIADYFVDFANARALEVIRDSADNVIIKKNATEGYSDRPTVILQGHSDMVIQADEGYGEKILTEGVKPIYDGDTIYAEGTTLGADNGVAVAIILAILDSDSISHPKIEALFTSNEEIGLLGAEALDPDTLDGRIMINLDSGPEGKFVAGCAGGRRVDIFADLQSEQVCGNRFILTLDGLKGGHSGVDINSHRTNAIKRIGEYLYALGDIRLIKLHGGSADNAIPSSATAEFTSNKSIDQLFAIIEGLRAGLDENFEVENVTLALSGECTQAITAEDTKRVISLIEELPYGVIAMSKELSGLVETSINIGIISADTEKIKITNALRSSKAQSKEALAVAVKDIALKYSMSSSERDDYPGWDYSPTSHLRETMCKIYKRSFGKDAVVSTIHAGLECGLFSEKLKGLDCVSTGPNASGAHTTKETLSISSTVRTYDFILEVLNNI